MARHAIVAVAVVVLASVCSVGRADDLASVKKKIESRMKETKSLRQEMRTTADMPGMPGKMESTGTMEMVRKDKDTWAMRQDMVMKMPKSDGSSGTEQTNMTVISDGQFLYTINEQGGQKMAMKMRADQNGQKVSAESGLDELEKHYDLKLLPDQTVNGKTVWAIEAKPKKADAKSAFDHMVMCYDQSTCMAVKVVTYGEGDKPISTTEFIKTELNAKIPDDRFVVPEGVQVMDMTQTGQDASQQAATEEKKDESAKADDQKKDEAPKASDQKKDEAPKPAEQPKSEPKKSDKAKNVLKKLF